MPFIRVDLMGEVDPEDLPPGTAENQLPDGFEYQNASGRFEPEELGSVARVMLQALLGAGATGFRVRYDGGFDEGFAYSETLLFGAEPRDAADVLRELDPAGLVAQIREAAGRESRWGNADEMYAGISPPEAAVYALDELATDLAMRLLGNNFGTGAYELYGAFTADFTSGTLVDDPNTVKPESIE